MAYLWLALAVLFEVGWAISMKLSDGFSRVWPSVATAVTYVLSVVCLALATRRMDVGMAYAIWAGCGVALVAIAGVMWFREPLSGLKVASLALILVGIVGLQLSGCGRH